MLFPSSGGCIFVVIISKTNDSYRVQCIVVTMSGVESFLRPFRGRGDDLSAFWSKFTVLSSARGWNTDEKRMSHLPLFLDGAAFVLYDQLSNEDKRDPAIVKKTLQDAFASSPGEAYHLFGQRHLALDEPVDAFLADLTKLLKLAGHSIAVNGKDPVLIEQFMSGLPSDISRALHIENAMGDLTLVQLVAKVRAVQASAGASYAAAAAAGGRSTGSRDGRRGGDKSVLCYKCGNVGHIQRFCKNEQKPSGGGGNSGGGRNSHIRCYQCQEMGHYRSQCKKKASVPPQDGSASAIVRGPDRVNVCLALPHASGDLVRVALDVKACDAPTWNRRASVVDTGCTQSLMEMALVDSLGLRSAMVDVHNTVRTIDGQPLRIHGRVEVQLRRLDGAVYLPLITVSLFVVDSLATLNTDMVVGSDIAKQVGGVHIEYSSGKLSSVTFGIDGICAGATTKKLPRHTSVQQQSGGVTLRSDDLQVTWSESKAQWEASWTWKDGVAPSQPLGTGVGEYSRKKLSPQMEEKFQAEIEMWRDNAWLVPYDKEAFGDPVCVLPLLAVEQAHKASTQVRPCLDYRILNDRLLSYPGLDAPACDQKLREWRVQDSDAVMLDLQKAYLQIRMVPALYKYQAVVWNGQLYDMTRMAFGLNIAPKVLDMVVKWVTKDISGSDNYVDDLYVPRKSVKATIDQLKRYGLTVKPPQDLPEARVLGLQLHTKDENLCWRRREDVNLQLPTQLTRRKVFSWCGKIVAHYPRCAWLRPACSYLKRVSSHDDAWDQPIPADVCKLAEDLAYRLQQQDPTHGQWSVKVKGDTVFDVWCDASGLALGTVIEVNGQVIEDGCWLRPKNDRKHINIAELEAVMKALTLVANWPAKKIRLHTDSKTVHGWLRQVLNERRVKVTGMHELLVKRQLQVIEEMVVAVGFEVDVV